MKDFDLTRLCKEVNAITSNRMELTERGFILNGISVSISGNIAEYKSTKIRFSNIFDLLSTLKFDGLFHATTEDIFILTTKNDILK